MILLLACGPAADLREGQSALDGGDLVTAEAAFRRVLAEDPTHAEGLYGVGWTWHLAGNTDAARGAFRQLAEAHPESPLGPKGLGSLALAEGNPVVARARFEEALRLAPNDLALRHSLGLVELAADNASAALPIFEQLCVEAPARAELQTARAEALLRTGRSEDALLAARKAVSLEAPPRVSAMARITLARTMLKHAAGRVDVADCAGTAPPVYAWLAEGDRVLDEAEATGIRLPDLPDLRRSLRAARAAVDDRCPGARSGKTFP